MPDVTAIHWGETNGTVSGSAADSHGEYAAPCWPAIVTMKLPEALVKSFRTRWLSRSASRTFKEDEEKGEEKLTGLPRLVDLWRETKIVQI